MESKKEAKETIFKEMVVIKENIEPHGHKLFMTYLNTLSNDELINVTLEFLGDTQLYRYIRVSIIRRIQEGEIEAFQGFIDELFKMFHSAKHQIAVKIASILIAIVDDLKPEQIEKIFYDLFFAFGKSKRLKDRKIACKLSSKINNKEVEEILWNIWEKYEDKNALRALVNTGIIFDEKNREKLKDLLSWDKLDAYLKRRFLLFLAEQDFDSIVDFRISDPVSYIYVAVKLNYTLDEEYLRKVLGLLNSGISDFHKWEDKGLFYWCLGKIKKRELILECILAEKNRRRWPDIADFE